jgi:hypothetical protein
VFFCHKSFLFFLLLFKIKTTTLFLGGIQSHDLNPVSSVAGGDDTTRPRRQGNLKAFFEFALIRCFGFSPIFGEKITFFLKTNSMITFN